jgi:predicted RNA-binding Zn-ribbon protein involved in translation (DUF1610 family)
VQEESGWRLSVEYTFTPQTTIDQLDALVGGRPRGAHGLTSHEVNRGPKRTTLQWEYPSFEDARNGLNALDEIYVVAKAHLVPPYGDRILNRAEYEIRASDARAGRAICVSCGHRIPLDNAMEFALAGVRPGNEAILRCADCSLPMAWVMLPER